MSTYVFAAAVTSLVFVAFVTFFRRGCGDLSCGTHARCGACPNAPDDVRRPRPPTEHDHA